MQFVLSKETVEVLKNFSTINQSILINPGNRIATMSIARNVYAEAEVQENFPIEFAIFNLNEFLSALSLFANPQLDFQVDHVLIKEDKSRIKYYFANKELIVYPKKQIKIPNDTIDFTLKKDVLEKLLKASIFGNDLVCTGNEAGIFLSIKDKKNAASNEFKIQVDDTPQKAFEFFLKLENLKFIPADYAVSISEKGIASFKRSDGTLHYAIALEAND